MKTHLLIILVFTAVLAACTTPEEDAANRFRAEQYRQQVEENNRREANQQMSAIESKCRSFGFRPGSDQFANCMRSEFNAIENNKRRAECMNEYSSSVARCTLSCAAKPNVYGRYMPGSAAACEAECKAQMGQPRCG